jgi:Mrp family chromosome partitioning ATPase
MAVVTGAALLVSWMFPPLYKATATSIGYVQQSDRNEGTPLPDNARRSLTELKQKAAGADRTLADFVARTGIADPEAKSRLLAARLLDVNTRFAKVRNDSAAEDALRTEYLRIKAEADVLPAQVAEFRALRERAAAASARYEDEVRRTGAQRPAPIVENVQSYGPSMWLNGAIALLGSLLFGCAAAVVFESRVMSIRSVSDIRVPDGDRPVIILPRVGIWRVQEGFFPFGQAGQEQGISRFREKIASLRDQLAEVPIAGQASVIAVVSARTRDGRSRIASELAWAFAAQERRTLLVDANLRNPALQALYAASGQSKGLSAALTGSVRWREALIQPSAPGLPALLPAGTFDQRYAELLRERLDGLLDEIVQDYEIVVLDSAAFPLFSGNLDLVRCADKVVVVARADATPVHAFRTMMGYLKRLNAGAAAVVLNDAVEADDRAQNPRVLSTTFSSGRPVS